MKQDFKPYKIGTIFNPIALKNKPNPTLKEVTLKYPMRLNSMALDPSKIISNNNMVYTPGEIIISVNLFTKTSVSLRSDDEIIIKSRVGRETIIKHAAEIMRKTFQYQYGFEIEIDADVVFPHAGLGSSGSILSSVICAINELFGKPMSTELLVKFIAQNYGEEIEGDLENINPVQCIGGSACSGNYNDGLIIIAGESEVIGSTRINDDYDVIIGIPSDFSPKDSLEMLRLEKNNFPKFLETGQKYGEKIAYRLIHEVLPSLKSCDLQKVGNLIFDYRFNMGSIENCAFCYDGLTEIAEKLREVEDQKLADILSLSSVGPAFFAITKEADSCEEIFLNSGLSTFRTKVYNKKYEKIIN